MEIMAIDVITEVDQKAHLFKPNNFFSDLRSQTSSWFLVPVLLTVCHRNST